jgi:NADPH:quinone reductase-like Zn-dependent oxidoreductase
MIVFGTMSREPLSFSSRDLMTPASRIEGFWLGNFLSRLGLAGKLRIIRTVGKLIREGVLASEVGRSFTLPEIKAAAIEAEREARGGKVLLRIGDA